MALEYKDVVVPSGDLGPAVRTDDLAAVRRLLKTHGARVEHTISITSRSCTLGILQR